jgi:hypothetical protein
VPASRTEWHPCNATGIICKHQTTGAIADELLSAAPAFYAGNSSTTPVPQSVLCAPGKNATSSGILKRFGESRGGQFQYLQEAELLALGEAQIAKSEFLGKEGPHVNSPPQKTTDFAKLSVLVSQRKTVR